MALGKLDPDDFAGGVIRLDMCAGQAAIADDIGGGTGLDPLAAAFGICEVVDENMANAARVHAVENGRNISDHVMIAFGGAAPLHAARLCEKLGIEHCLIPPGAGVGSAIGFLRAPFGYETLASHMMRLPQFDSGVANALLDDLKSAVERFVTTGETGAIQTEVTAFMRYRGQGWDISVPLPNRRFGPNDGEHFETLFRGKYADSSAARSTVSTTWKSRSSHGR